MNHIFGSLMFNVCNLNIALIASGDSKLEAGRFSIDESYLFQTGLRINVN